MDQPECTIIGMGSLGSVLARSIIEQEGTVKNVFSRSGGVFAHQKVELEIKPFPTSTSELGKIVFITVADDVLEKVAQRVADLGSLFDGITVVHCSGQRDSSVLYPIAKKGGNVAAFHPLQTFTGSENSEIFKGIYFDIEGDPSAVQYLKSLAKFLGAESFEVTPAQKSYLHISAVFASNYIISLLSASEQIAERGGMNGREVRLALLPLVKKSIENAENNQLAEVLSGPLARGDYKTVKEHIELLKENSDYERLYKQLGNLAAGLAEQKGKLSSVELSKLSKLLDV